MFRVSNVLLPKGQIGPQPGLFDTKLLVNTKCQKVIVVTANFSSRQRQLRRFGSSQQMDEGQLSPPELLSPIQSRKILTSTPKKQVIRPQKCIDCCRAISETQKKSFEPPEYTSFDSDKFLSNNKFHSLNKKEVQSEAVDDDFVETSTIRIQTDSPITHRIV